MFIHLIQIPTDIHAVGQILLMSSICNYLSSAHNAIKYKHQVWKDSSFNSCCTINTILNINCLTEDYFFWNDD
jgi:hypothetical protein